MNVGPAVMANLQWGVRHFSLSSYKHFSPSPWTGHPEIHKRIAILHEVYSLVGSRLCAIISAFIARSNRPHFLLLRRPIRLLLFLISYFVINHVGAIVAGRCHSFQAPTK